MWGDLRSYWHLLFNISTPVNVLDNLKTILYINFDKASVSDL